MVALLSRIRTSGFVSADVLRLLFGVLFDDVILRKEVFLEWALAATQHGKDLALTSLSSFFMWMSKTEDAGYAERLLTLLNFTTTALFPVILGIFFTTKGKE